MEHVRLKWTSLTALLIIYELIKFMEYHGCHRLSDSSKCSMNPAAAGTVQLQRYHISDPKSQITSNSIVCSTAFNKENIKALRYCYIVGDPPVTSGFPSQKASNAESILVSWQLTASVPVRLVLTSVLYQIINQNSISTHRCCHFCTAGTNRLIWRCHITSLGNLIVEIRRQPSFLHNRVSYTGKRPR